MHTRNKALTLPWWRSPSYRNQSNNLLCKSMDWFLYDRDLFHERVKTLFTHHTPKVCPLYRVVKQNSLFFSICVFSHENSRFTGQQGKREAISLYPFYHFHSPHRHLDISRVIDAESSPLLIAGSWIRTGNLLFPNASR